MSNRLLILATVTACLFSASCSKTRACKDKTLFVSYDLGAASDADSLRVTVSVDGENSKTNTIQRKASASKSSLEIDFPNGYPAEKPVDVTVFALLGNTVVWEGHGATVLPANCGTLPLIASTVELSDLGVDLAPVNDDGGPIIDMQMSPSADMTGAPPPPDMTVVCGKVSMACCSTGNACVQGAQCQNAVCTESDIWIAGANISDISNIKTVLAHYDGQSWTVNNSINQDNAGLALIWGDSPDDYYMGGSNGNAYWFNGQWNQCVGGGACPPTASSTTFQAIHGIASNDIWFAGSNDVLHYNGFNFVRQVNGLPSTYYMSAICGRTSNDIWGVSLSGSYHWNGTQWTSYPNTKAAGCWAASPNDVWAAGNTIQHWDGTSWSTAYQVDGGALPGTILRVDGTATDDVWGVGSDTNSNAVNVRWNGSSWNRVQGGGSNNLSWIWAVSKTDAWIPTASGMLRWNGSAWVAYTGLPTVANTSWGLIWGSATGGQ